MQENSSVVEQWGHENKPNQLPKFPQRINKEKKLTRKNKN